MATDDVERLFKQYLGEMSREASQDRATASEVLAKVQVMFTNVLKELGDLKTEVRTDIADVRQEIRGVKARVSMLEKSGPPPGASLAPRQIKTLETYEKTNTGTFRLTDFELHDLHSEAQTWRGIKKYVSMIGVPVGAFLVIGLLVWLGVHIWH